MKTLCWKWSPYFAANRRMGADCSAKRGSYVLFRAADDITNQLRAGDVKLPVHVFSHRT